MEIYIYIYIYVYIYIYIYIYIQNKCDLFSTTKAGDCRCTYSMGYLLLLQKYHLSQVGCCHYRGRLLLTNWHELLLLMLCIRNTFASSCSAEVLCEHVIATWHRLDFKREQSRNWLDYWRPLIVLSKKDREEIVCCVALSSGTTQAALVWPVVQPWCRSEW